jgi:hypothetical protein
LIGRLEIYRFNFNQSEVSLAFLGWANLPTHCIARAQIKLSDLRWRNINVVGARQVVVFGRTQETKAIRQCLEHALGEDESALLRLRREHLEDQLLLAHAGRARHVHAFSDAGQFGDRHLLEVGEV